MPTFQNMRRGQGSPTSTPKRWVAGRCNSYNQLTRNGKPFRSKPFNAASIYITGITKDSVSAPSEYYATLKYWNGSSWVRGKLKYYNGASFVEKPTKIWNGVVWELINSTGI